MLEASDSLGSVSSSHCSVRHDTSDTTDTSDQATTVSPASGTSHEGDFEHLECFLCVVSPSNIVNNVW